MSELIEIVVMAFSIGASVLSIAVSALILNERYKRHRQRKKS